MENLICNSDGSFYSCDASVTDGKIQVWNTWWMRAENVGKLTNKGNYFKFDEYSADGIVYVYTIVDTSRDLIVGVPYSVHANISTFLATKARYKIQVFDCEGLVTEKEGAAYDQKDNTESLVFIPRKKSSSYLVRIVFNNKQLGIVNAQCNCFRINWVKFNMDVKPAPYSFKSEFSRLKRLYQVYNMGLIVDLYKADTSKYFVTWSFEEMRIPPNISFDPIHIILTLEDNSHFELDMSGQTEYEISSYITTNGITLECSFTDFKDSGAQNFLKNIPIGTSFRGRVDSKVILDSRF